MTAAKYNEFFAGWLAFRNGSVVVSKDRKVKVFRTEAAALKAAAASKMVSGWKK